MLAHNPSNKFQHIFPKESVENRFMETATTADTIQSLDESGKVQSILPLPGKAKNSAN